MLNHLFHQTPLFLQVNHLLPNHLISNHHIQHISIAAVHHHLINMVCLHHPLSMDHHHIYHSIVYHRLTTVMVPMAHHENIAMNNIKTFFKSVFFFKWPMPIDNSIYYLMVIHHHQMVYGALYCDLFLVSLEFSLFYYL